MRGDCATGVFVTGSTAPGLVRAPSPDQYSHVAAGMAVLVHELVAEPHLIELERS